MKIPSFRIENKRNIRLAECSNVPNVMIITGPNGSGKSTLLQELRSMAVGGRPMYMGPHRASRRQRVRFRFLGEQIRMRSVMEGDQLPGREGIEHINRARTPWDNDDSASFLKYGLCQIELDRREAIAERYDQDNEISKDSLGDVWRPLREMAENLLPHLSFDKIDTSNREQIQCLWKVHQNNNLVDIDDLSSGEKSIIQLFYPLVEHRVRALLEELKGETKKQKDGGKNNDVEDVINEADSLCVIIDEPELHLHPNLQGKILDYIRNISIREDIQFILASHSPTIVENSNSDELYLLRPSEMVANDENQLVQIASDDEKLHLLREVFGLTSNLTAMRPILVVEGKQVDRQSRRAADARIYAFLSNEFGRVTVVPAGGKSECRKLANSLSQLLKDYSTNLGAHALLDRDLEEDKSDEGVHLLPVSMVENLLIDPRVIWEATALVRHKTDLSSIDEVESSLDEILDWLSDSEVARRIKGTVGTRVFRLQDPVDSADDQVTDFSDKLKSELSYQRISDIRKQCEATVEAITVKHRRREFFHGKRIIEEFYKRHLHSSGMSKEMFVYECARCASERESVKTFVSDLMTSLGLQNLSAG